MQLTNEAFIGFLSIFGTIEHMKNTPNKALKSKNRGVASSFLTKYNGKTEK